MRRIKKPADNAGEVFLKCLSSIKDYDLRDRLKQIETLIDTKAFDFENHIGQNSLYKIERNKVYKNIKRERIFGEIVTIDEAKSVYIKGFSAKGSGGRYLYDRIYLSSPYNKCPYCFHRNVMTIDHYLPKAYYPLLSVVPINLVPSCTDCNTSELRATYPTTPSEEILHPYFDNVENVLWLKAKVLHTSPASMIFYVDPPNDERWSPLLKERVKYHFDTLQLNKLYSIESVLEFINLEGQCIDQFNNGGAEALRNHLVEIASSKGRAFLNSWQTAMYSALAEDEWFHNGGFVIQNL